MAKQPQNAADLPVLYSFRRCPYAMRARMAIAASGQAVELREVILRDKPAHMVSLSPKGTVPVLWLERQTVIDESRDVMAWALAQHDPFNWLARADKALVDAYDDTFKHHLDRYKYATRYRDEAPANEQTEHHHRAICHDMLRQLEPLLAQGWLGGETAGYTDVAILPFIRQFRIADPVWFDTHLALPNVQKWVMQFLDWPVFTAVMQKYDLWQSGQQGICFQPPLPNK